MTRLLPSRFILLGGILVILGLLAPLLAGAPASAQATTVTLVSSFATATDAQIELAGYDNAQGFVTGANAGGYTLTSIDMDLLTWGVGTESISLDIYNSKNGNPGNKLGTLTTGDITSTSPDLTSVPTTSFTHTGIKLDSNTRYFVFVASKSSSILRFRTISQNTETGQSGWSVDDNRQFKADGATSWSTNSQSWKVRLKGTVDSETALLSNTGQTVKSSSTGLNLTDQAQAFTTGAFTKGYVLTSVGIHFKVVSAQAAYAVSIHENNNGRPGEKVGDLTAPASLANNAVNSFTASGISLYPSTTYFVVIDSSSNVVNSLSDTTSDSEDASSLTGWSIGNGFLKRSRDSTGGWQTSTDSKMIVVSGYERTLALNQSPAFEAATFTRSFFEGLPAGTSIGDPVAATDADGDTLTYTLGGADAASFDIVSTSGQIQTKAGVTYDADTKAAYSVTVTASDGTDSASATVTITVEQPLALVLSTISTTDLEARWDSVNGAVWYCVLWKGPGENYTDASDPQNTTRVHCTAERSYRITGLTPGLTYGVKVEARVSQTNLNLVASDEGSGTTSASDLVFNTNQGNHFTSNVDLNLNDVLQKFTTGPNTLGYGFKVTRVDILFRSVIAGSESAVPSVSIYTDNNGSPGTLVGALDSPATISTASFGLTHYTSAAGIQLAANTGYWVIVDSDAAVAHVLRNTPDNNQTGLAGWSIADNQKFRSRTAGGGTDGTVNNAILKVGLVGYARASNSAPAFSSSTVTRSFFENAPAGTPVGDPVTASDADNDTLTYTLGGTDAASFDIDAATGQLRAKSGVTYDYETRTTYSVTVTATDTFNTTASATVTINVADVNENAQPIWRPQTSGVTADLEAVHFVDADTGWAVGASGTILRTTDGGANWSAQNSGTSESLWDVDFVDANNGWIVGNRGTILHTTDGGANWSAQNRAPSNDLDGVDFVDGSKGWAVGAVGVIRHTTDGGANWSAQTSGTSALLYDVHFVDASKGWAVGAGGTILRTTDGGANWSAQTSNTTRDLSAVDFADAGKGWAVGSSGTILRTTDGGANWSPQTSRTTRSLWGIHFVDANRGWAVGASGTVLGTIYGGANWSPQSSGTSQTLNGVDFVDADTGWAVGDSGTILALREATVFTRNLGETKAAFLPRLDRLDWAQAFTTAPNEEGYLLTGVSIGMFFGSNDATYEVKIFSDSNGSPGSSLATLTAPATQSTGNVRFTHAGLTLQGDTTYWVVIDIPSVDNNVDTSIDLTSSAGEKLAGDWSIHGPVKLRRHPGATWLSDAFLSGSIMMSIDGFAGETPTALELSLSPESIGEGDGETSVTVTVSLDKVSYRDRSVDVNIGAGSTQGAADFSTRADSRVIAFPAGRTSDTVIFAVTPVDDMLIDWNGAIEFRASYGSLSATAELPIIDNDLPYVLWETTMTAGVGSAANASLSGYSANDFGSLGDDTIELPGLTYTVTDLYVSRDTSGGGDHAANFDYTAEGSATHAGTYNLCIEGTPHEIDKFGESSQDTYSVPFIPIPAAFGNRQEVHVKMIKGAACPVDGLAVTAHFPGMTTSIDEGAQGAYEITLTASLVGTRSSSAIEVTFSLGGTATLGTDYTRESSDALKCTISVGEKSCPENFSIRVVDDEEGERTEFIEITALHTSAGTGEKLKAAAQLAILDNDRSCIAEPITLGEITDTLNTECESIYRDRPGVYARNYSFSLTEAQTVVFRMSSQDPDIDPFLYLLHGADHERAYYVPNAYNDDFAEGHEDARVIADLEPGDYIVHATTFHAGEMGEFSLLYMPYPADGNLPGPVGPEVYVPLPPPADEPSPDTDRVPVNLALSSEGLLTWDLDPDTPADGETAYVVRWVAAPAPPDSLRARSRTDFGRSMVDESGCEDGCQFQIEEFDAEQRYLAHVNTMTRAVRGLPAVVVRYPLTAPDTGTPGETGGFVENLALSAHGLLTWEPDAGGGDDATYSIQPVSKVAV